MSRIDHKGKVSNYGQAALNAEAERVRQAGQGNRNHQLNSSSFGLGQLIGGGVLSRSDVETALRDAAQANGLFDDDGGERGVDATIKSGIEAGMKKPRGVPESDHHLSNGKSPKGEIVASYDYVDEDGELLYQAVRYQPKSFAQRRPDGSGGWIWKMKGVRYVLYHLPEVLEAVVLGRQVFIVEGEKDADTLTTHGLTATTNIGGAAIKVGGAGKWRPEYIECLRGAQVVILPDRDSPGRKHGQHIAASLQGIAASLKVVEVPEGKDVTEWMESHGGSQDVLLQLVDAAPEWTPPTETVDPPGVDPHVAGGAEPPASEGTPPPADDRPEIIIDVDEERVNNQAVAALKTEKRLFQRGNALVHVLRDEATTKKIIRPPGSPRIMLLPNAVLREMLSTAAAWKKYRAKRNGEMDLIPAHPPDWSTSNIAERGCWPEIRYLEAVVEVPTLRADGTILDIPGWDAATGLLYEPRIHFPAIPMYPTKEAARVAAEILLDLVAQFPFVSSYHLAAWLSALLTPLARFAFVGPTPLFLFTANIAGSGKTLLASLISEIVEGRELSRTPYSVKDEEMDKTITAIALNGDKLILLDNIDAATPFGCASLDAALTGTSWKRRILGVSEMTPDLPLFTVWFASGNNVALRGDIHRRIIPIRLESEEEKPEARSNFKYPDLVGHVRENRAALVVAALTILRGYVVAGRPMANLPALGSFEGWSELVRKAVHWATDRDPAGTRDDLADADETRTTLALVLEGWSQLPKGTGDGVTAREALAAVKENSDAYHQLREVFTGWSKTSELPGSRVVGNRLRALRRRVLNGRSLHADEDRDGYMRWKVVGKTAQTCGV